MCKSSAASPGAKRSARSAICETARSSWGDGRRPGGVICVAGVLYLAFQNMLGSRRPPCSLISQLGSDAEIVRSANKSMHGVPALGAMRNPVLPGHRFGGPAFVNYGRNHSGAKDRFVHAISTGQWHNGSNLRVARVPSDETYGARPGSSSALSSPRASSPGGSI